MLRWFIGHNNFWYFASIYLEETPWYLVAAENCVMYVCDFISRLNIRLLSKRLLEDYGDWGGLFHVFVCNNVIQFVWKHTKSKVVELPYFFLKDQFPESFKEEEDDFDDDPQRKINEMRARALDKEFKDAYNRVIEHSMYYKKGKES